MVDYKGIASSKGLRLFLLIAFDVAWLLFLLPLAFGPVGSPNRQVATLIAWTAVMWAPGLAAIIATRADGAPLSTLRLAYLGERRAYLWAWLLPPALTIAAGALTVLLGAGRLDLEFSMLRKALEAAGGQAPSPQAVILLQALSGLTIGPLLNTLAALGEELGWRAYLLPRLYPLGRWRAIVISGAIWGVWHAPAILQGHNYPDHPLLGVLLMIGFTILFGAILSWLYLRTRSPWAPALGHASLNAFAGMPLLLITGQDMALGGTLTSLIGWIPMLAFVAWLAWSGKIPERLPGNEEDFVGEISG